MGCVGEGYSLCGSAAAEMLEVAEKDNSAADMLAVEETTLIVDEEGNSTKVLPAQSSAP